VEVREKKIGREKGREKILVEAVSGLGPSGCSDELFG
jgi:hypothetical protein